MSPVGEHTTRKDDGRPNEHVYGRGTIWQRTSQDGLTWRRHALRPTMGHYGCPMKMTKCWNGERHENMCTQSLLDISPHCNCLRSPLMATSFRNKCFNCSHCLLENNASAFTKLSVTRQLPMLHLFHTKTNAFVKHIDIYTFQKWHMLHYYKKNVGSA